MALSQDDETIHRVLFVASRVHVYQVPPVASNKGPVAAGWTTDPAMHIFTARVRVIESSSQSASASAAVAAHPPPRAPSASPAVTTSIRLEDPATAELFAEAPYANPATVQAATDSARFFAVRVVGDGGRRKATLGIGFEERGEALDFGLALREAGKGMGWAGSADGPGRGTAAAEPPKRDWGLKEGEVLTVDIKGLRKRSEEGEASWTAPAGGGLLAPPPGDAGGLLPPPPNSREVRAERRRSREISAGAGEADEKKQNLEALGFDDGEFGEFV